MTNDERDIQRKLRVLQHAEKIGNARKACRYFGIGRSSFYRWRDAYQKRGEAGLKNAKSIPKNPANQTPIPRERFRPSPAHPTIIAHQYSTETLEIRRHPALGFAPSHEVGQLVTDCDIHRRGFKFLDDAFIHLVGTLGGPDAAV